jgi:dTDP-4-amino-4,6-dideoxygalactose transaminase
MKVPLLDLSLQYQQIKGELDEAVVSVLSGQHFILGPEVARLERAIAEYCDVPFAVGCASGSDALLLALMALDIGRGDEVITTSYSFFATAGSISRLGARPVFVDIDPETFNIDSADVASKITGRTKAILPVHLFGQCAALHDITAIAKDAGIPVIEDAAQAIGAEIGNRRAGSIGQIGTFSFYPTKNLGCAGDGGMLTVTDAATAERLKSLRGHGARRKYYHESVGVNSRLDTLQAAILLVKLKYLDQWTQARQCNAQRYREMFQLAGLVESGKVKLPVESEGVRHVYNQFVIRVPNRDDLRVFLRDRDIGTEVYYPLPLHLQECFRDLGYQEGDLPVSEAASRESLAIPIYPELSEAAQKTVVDEIRAFYK